MMVSSGSPRSWLRALARTSGTGQHGQAEKGIELTESVRVQTTPNENLNLGNTSKRQLNSHSVQPCSTPDSGSYSPSRATHIRAQVQAAGSQQLGESVEQAFAVNRHQPQGSQLQQEVTCAATVAQCAHRMSKLFTAAPQGSKKSSAPASAGNQGSRVSEWQKDRSTTDHDAAQRQAVGSQPAVLTGAGSDALTVTPLSDAPARSTASAGEAYSSQSRTGPLPASGDLQLDRYLRYLLQEQHPHKFMYYPGWGLTDDGCAAVGTFLRRDKRIKVMTLSSNSISNDGVGLIAHGLAYNSSLLTLDLSDNAVGDAGAIQLAEALHSASCQVVELLLSNNHIGDDGADALAAAVASCPLVKKLNLSGNPISAGQLDIVRHALKSRAYKMSAGRAVRQATRTTHQSPQHDIELMEGQSCAPCSSLLLHRCMPPPVAIAALTQPQDPLEVSLSLQASHLLAEAQHFTGQQAGQSILVSEALLQDAPDKACVQPSCHASTQQGIADLTVLLAIRLSGRGYDVTLRTCFPRVDTAQCQQAVSGHVVMQPPSKHTFLRVCQPGPRHQAVELPTIIVDPTFRDVFAAQNAPQRLQDVLNAVPQVLCLAEQRLWHVVELLCAETAAAYKAAQARISPCMHTSACLDLWLSPIHHDLVVDAEKAPHQLQAELQSVWRDSLMPGCKQQG